MGEFIARINTERGGFRNVTETELREEIKARDEGRLDSSPEGESESDDETDGDKSKTIVEARDEFLKNIEIAHNNAVLGLDFVSLLLSKENPNQANTTLSPALRDLVGVGVLGATKHANSSITPARVQGDLAVAVGWRMIGTNKMVDSVLEAAERLEKEISLETKYWADVLAVSDNGWTVTSLPYESHTLGVRYGFAESAPEYRNSSIAPLRRGDDGTAQLDPGAAGGGSKRVQCIIERDGQVTGRSRLPGRLPDRAPLQDRVLEARNTIFAQELWYEINKEARALLSANVRSTDAGLVYDVDTSTKIILTLEDLDHPDVGDGLPDSQMATTVSLGLHFLLIFSHRLNYFKRTQSTQATANRNASSSGILRSLLSRLTYDRSWNSLAYFLTELKAVLKQAGLSSATFTQSFVPPGPQISPWQSNQLALQQTWRAKPSEALIINLFQLLEFSSEVTITPQARMVLRGRSFASPIISTGFMISLPSSQEENQPQQLSNPLEDAYPPLSNEPYPNVDEAIHYVRQASVRAIVDSLTEAATEKLGRHDISWSETMDGAMITANGNKELRVNISHSPRLALNLDLQWVEGKDLKSRKLVWNAGQGDSEKIEDAVVNFCRG